MNTQSNAVVRYRLSEDETRVEALAALTAYTHVGNPASPFGATAYDGGARARNLVLANIGNLSPAVRKLLVSLSVISIAAGYRVPAHSRDKLVRDEAAHALKEWTSRPVLHAVR